MTLLDLHLSSAYNADQRGYRISHACMVYWIVSNFRKMKSGEVTYQEYVNEAKSAGIMHFNEQKFEEYKTQDFV